MFFVFDFLLRSLSHFFLSTFFFKFFVVNLDSNFELFTHKDILSSNLNNFYNIKIALVLYRLRANGEFVFSSQSKLFSEKRWLFQLQSYFLQHEGDERLLLPAQRRLFPLL